MWTLGGIKFNFQVSVVPFTYFNKSIIDYISQIVKENKL